MDNELNGAARPTIWSEGDHPLVPKEQAKVQAALDSGETVVRTARGRTDGKAQIWALTDKRLLAVGTGWLGRTQPIAFESIVGIEEQEGAHGTTLQLDLTTGRTFLVAVAPAACRDFVAGLAARCNLTPTFVPSRKPKPKSVSVPMRQPPISAQSEQMHPADEMVRALERLASLHASGVLNDQEFAEAKQKLLR